MSAPAFTGWLWIYRYMAMSAIAMVPSDNPAIPAALDPAPRANFMDYLFMDYSKAMDELLIPYQPITVTALSDNAHAVFGLGLLTGTLMRAGLKLNKDFTVHIKMGEDSKAEISRSLTISLRPLLTALVNQEPKETKT